MKCRGCTREVYAAPDPEGSDQILVECGTHEIHTEARCASPRLTPAERETLRGLVDAVPEFAPTHSMNRALLTAARNAVAIIARLLGES